MYNVIIADDEKKIRTVLKALIHWDELQLNLNRECEDGDDLLNVLEKIAADIVITDMQMPGICGVELLQSLRTEYPYVTVLVISGYDDFKYMRQAIISQAVDYILKPVEEDELNDALKKAILKARDNRIKMIQSGNCEEQIAPRLARYFNNIYEIETKLANTEKQSLASEIKKYLDEKYRCHITLSDLEKKFFSNKEYISRIYKNIYGVTIFDYLDHLRIWDANSMLIRGKTVKEITYALGYYDESHFYKKYKKIMGILPSEYNI